MKRLTRRNEDSFFKQDFERDELFTSDFDWFLASDVKKLALKNKITILYCKPGTSEYKKYGCTTFKVISTKKTRKKKEQKRKKVYFDPKFLVT